MAETAQRLSPMTVEEYLAREERSPVRHELVDGVAYAMGGASDRHNIIAGNLFAALHAHLPESCQVFMADMRLRLRTKSEAAFYYPDVLVSCARGDRASHHREKPILLVEVLSPTTERVDRKEKLDAYVQIPSLAEYLIADQDRPLVEIHRRSNGWRRESFAAGESLTLESVELATTVAALYRRTGLVKG